MLTGKPPFLDVGYHDLTESTMLGMMQRIKAGSYSQDTQEWQCISEDAKKLVQGTSLPFFCLYTMPIAAVEHCSVSDVIIIKPLDSKGNYSATANNTKLVHWLLMGGLIHLVQRRGAWADCSLAQASHGQPRNSIFIRRV